MISLLPIIALATGGMFTALGIQGLAESAASRHVTNLAKQIERGTFQGDPISASRISLRQVVKASTCLPTHLRADLTLRLLEFDITRSLPFDAPERSVERLETTYQKAITATEQVLGCAPADGNAWLRRAMVKTTSEGPTITVLQSLERSLWLAPYEANIDNLRRDFAHRLDIVGVDHPILETILAHNKDTP